MIAAVLILGLALLAVTLMVYAKALRLLGREVKRLESNLAEFASVLYRIEKGRDRERQAADKVLRITVRELCQDVRALKDNSGVRA